MEIYWLTLILIGAVVVISVIGSLLGLNFNIILDVLRDMLKKLRVKGQENKIMKKQKK